MASFAPRRLPLHFLGPRLLIVLDHRGYVPCSFAAEQHGPSHNSEAEYPWFGLSQVVAQLRKNPSFQVTLAHRGVDPAPGSPVQHNHFVFTTPALSEVDVVWMIGAGNDKTLVDGEVAVNTDVDSYPLLDAEVQAITTFMHGGGGVMAVGDHSDFGCSMGHYTPRVRQMRYWVEGEAIPPPAGPGVIATVQPSASDTVSYPVPPGWPLTFASEIPLEDSNQNSVPANALNVAFEDQSDDVPAPILPTLYQGPPAGPGSLLKYDYYIHPLFLMPSGEFLHGLPDHMHEGNIPILDDMTWDGADWPTGADGTQPTPSTIARGRALREVDHVEYSPEGGFVTAYQDPGQPGPGENYGVIGAYDGHPIAQGRVVTHSTFHHFFDINLIGDRDCVPSDPRSKGFLSSIAGAEFLAQLEIYFANMVWWLARPRTFVLGFHNLMINANYSRHLAEAVGPLGRADSVSLGARRELGRLTAGAMSLTGWSRALMLEACIEASGMSILPPTFTGMPGARTVLPADHADAFLDHAVSGAVLAVHRFSRTAARTDGRIDWDPAHPLIDTAIADGFRAAVEELQPRVSKRVAALAAVGAPPAPAS